jgi:hypothetical protein
MRAVLLPALLLAGLVSNAAAQQVFGPVAIKNNVNGVPISVSATSSHTVRTDGNMIVVNARILADLIDLQRKFSSVVSAFAPPADRCAKRPGNNQNPIAVLESGSLWPRDDQLIMSLRGYIDVWSCISGPKKSALRWKKKKIAFLKMKVPVIKTWRKVTKKRDGVQSFHGSLHVYLVENHNAAVAVKPAKPDIKLEGDESVVTDENLRVAEAKIRQKAYDALQLAIDPAKLKQALPEQLQKLNMTVVSTRFRDLGGHAIAEINLGAQVAEDPITQLLQETVARSSN